MADPMSKASRWALAEWLRAGAVVVAWCVVLLTSPAVVVRAQELASPQELGGTSPTTRDSGSEALQDHAPREKGAAATESNSSTHWLDQLARTMLGTDGAEHESRDLPVLHAFRDAVAEPAKSTVRIVCREKQVALGVIIDSDGFVATKASELDGAADCIVSDGSRYAAELIGIDRGSDLALLHIKAEGLSAIRWSDVDPPSVGGWVVTPGTSELPVAIGVVSVAPHHVRGGVLGIQMAEDKIGPRITFVVPESAAATAGLKRGDVITHVNRQRMENADGVIAVTSNALPGDKLDVTVLRDRHEHTLSATLGSVASTLSSSRARFQDQLGGPLSQRRVLFPSALEHDSVLSPQQCGGALTNLDGAAIGINVARASRIASYAIPAGVARPILEQLKSQAHRSAQPTPVADSGPSPSLSATSMDR